MENELTIADEFANQRKQYEEQLDYELGLTEQERKEIINNAVDASKVAPAEFACKLCFKTVFEPKICLGCNEALFCKLCLDEHLENSEVGPQCPACEKGEGFDMPNEELMLKLSETHVQCIAEGCCKLELMMKYRDFV